MKEAELAQGDFEPTGEIRIPKEGEYYVCTITGNILKAGYGRGEPRRIMRLKANRAASPAPINGPNEGRSNDDMAIRDEARRKKAMELIRDGKKPKEIAEEIGGGYYRPGYFKPQVHDEGCTEGE